MTQIKLKHLNTYFHVAIIAILIVVMYYPIIIDLVDQWLNDSNYSHGLLIPLIAGYFIWQKRDQLKKINVHKSNIGLIVLLGGLVINIAGTAAAEFFTVRLSLIIVIIGILIYFYGLELFKTIWFPLLFLFFMVPLPYVIYYAITFPMQLLSTKLSAAVLQFTGFSILRQGNIIHLPNYSLEVVEACSGLRSLMTLTALGAALAYLTQKNIFTGVGLFLLSIPIAIIANVIRIIITAIGAYLISPKFADGFLHEASGLVVFMVGFISLGIAGLILRRLTERRGMEGAIDA
ncbi:exosortase/archaeosortase family protein [candidate division KSB1 bacterium]|nr:exosortase/archaeosortase family protein [candidate division KSB1 bacterium]